MLTEVSGCERLVLSPQPLGNLAHRRAAQQMTACFVGERVLDIPRRQPSCIELDREILERSGPPSDVLPDRRYERFGRLAHLGRCELHHSFSRLQPTLAIAIAVSTRLACRPFVAVAANLVPHLAFERLFQDQLRRQEHQVRPVRCRPQPAVNQGPKALACPLRGGYSLHRDAPCRAPAPTGSPLPALIQAGCIPTLFSSNPTPLPVRLLALRGPLWPVLTPRSPEPPGRFLTKFRSTKR